MSPACAHCYARTQAKVRSKMFFGFVVEWGAGKPRGERLEKARIEALALDRQAKKKGIRYRIFVNSMSDWLDEEVPIEWLAFLLETLKMCPNLDFQLLTKRPGNFGKRVYAAAGARKNSIACWVDDWLGGYPPENVWIGTTVENQEWADKRVPQLVEIPAKVRFLSCEPLLGAVNLERWISLYRPPEADTDPNRPRPKNIHQVIGGGESGGHARMTHPRDLRSLRDQCAANGVAFYFKQWGEWAPQGELLPVQLPDTAKLKGKWLDSSTLMLRFGKDRTGAYLDGKEWKQFPREALAAAAVIP